jgi:hypothetical protein
MATAEDVFYLYERNSTYYYNCNALRRMSECPDCWGNECFCHEKQITFPLTIGHQITPCHFKRKCYIKPGEECSICMENIITKSNAYLTCCGHTFHKSCIFKYVETKWKTKYASNLKCPICRTNIGTDALELSNKTKYNPISRNNLDILDNFWNNKELILTQRCSNNYDHDIGMHSNCDICISYRENGDLLYRIN